MKYFVDTSFWCALYDSRDNNHQQAAGIWKELNPLPLKLVISDYVFDETITLVRKRIGHPEAVNLGEIFLQSKVAILLEITPEIRNKGWQMFKRYEDKDFSFTDCTSFVLMQYQKITKVLAFDHHFKQAGFLVNNINI